MENEVSSNNEPGDDTRLHVEHMATTMYCNRVSEDTNKGKADLYQRNPDSCALYFKGIHDTLLCLEAWLGMGTPPNTLGMFMEALHSQTVDSCDARH